MILFKLVTNQDTIICRKFLNELGLQLAKLHMKRRFEKNVSRELRNDIEDILYEDLKEEKPSASELPKKIAESTRYYLCPISADRKSKTRCNKCSQVVCSGHQIKICENGVK